VPFAEFRDLDDVMARLIEIITPDGDYCWAMTADINQLAIQPLARPRDLIWRPARIEIRGGLAGEVWLPALYIGPAERMDDALRLGRRTDWIEEPDAPVRGRGLRSFLIDDDDVPIHELGTVEFDPGPAAQP
jgi:type VI secretion system protein ImpE